MGFPKNEDELVNEDCQQQQQQVEARADAGHLEDDEKESPKQPGQITMTKTDVLPAQQLETTEAAEIAAEMIAIADSAPSQAPPPKSDATLDGRGSSLSKRPVGGRRCDDDDVRVIV